MKVEMRWVRPFSEIGIDDVPLVGGKNASLGEMTRELGSLGVRVPEGYAVTADAYRYFLRANDLEGPLGEAMAGLERGDVEGLRRTSRSIQNSVVGAEFPEDLETEILRGYGELSAHYGEVFTDVAVRSSATAEDLPTASFAGQQESYLNVHGDAQLLDSVKRCFASLFTPRAISYREDMGFDHLQVALSVGVQKMVRSDLASSGVIFTLDTESGFPDVVFVTSTWGLGENIVQGRVVPDGFYVHKPTLAQGYAPLIRKRLGTKEFKLDISRLTRGYEDKTEFFVDRLAQGIGTLAAAFWPRPVILRFSYFKTNEYAHLLGGEHFEPHEENPMLGWRGSSRYYHPDYKEGFLLELKAVKRVRETFGLKNLKVMIPFCRTPEEGLRVLEVLEEGGLVRGEDGLEVYVMAEIPSNVVLAREFAEIFDGFSIGSNDLTQLVLGVDRDSERVAPLFDERNEAVRRMCATLIEKAHRAGRKVEVCGQAPSDYPEFAAFLVERGIDSISLSPDAVVPTTMKILEVERQGTVPQA